MKKKTKRGKKTKAEQVALSERLVKLKEKELKLETVIDVNAGMQRKLEDDSKGLSFLENIELAIARLNKEGAGLNPFSERSIAVEKQIKDLELLRNAVAKSKKAEAETQVKTLKGELALEKALEGIKEQIALQKKLNTEGERAMLIQKKINELERVAPFGKLKPKEIEQIKKDVGDLFDLRQTGKKNKRGDLAKDDRDFTSLQKVGANFVSRAGGIDASSSNQKRNDLLGGIKKELVSIRLDRKQAPTDIKGSREYAV